MLLWNNNWGGQINDTALGDFISRAQPDMMSFDTYPYAPSSQPAGGSPTNWYGDLVIADYRNTHFSNAAFADLVKQANAETDVGKRHALFLQANKILETEQPYTGLYNPTDRWLVKPNVAGLEHEGVLDEFHIGEASFK